MNDFQQDIIRASTQLLNSLSIHSDINFEHIYGHAVDYYMAAIYISETLMITIYVYSDGEAGFEINGQKWIMFEKEDYASQADLVMAFINKIAIVVGK